MYSCDLRVVMLHENDINICCIFLLRSYFHHAPNYFNVFEHDVVTRSVNDHFDRVLKRYI